MKYPLLCQLVMHSLQNQNQNQRPSPNLWLGNCPWHHCFPKTKQCFQLSTQICAVHVPLVLSLGVHDIISGGQNNIMHA